MRERPDAMPNRPSHPGRRPGLTRRLIAGAGRAIEDQPSLTINFNSLTGALRVTRPSISAPCATLMLP